MTGLKIAIVGAGLAGVTLARQLTRQYKVSLFEKSRGLGGRMAVRRDETASFNHGAQFFTARSDPFKKVVSEAIDQGVAKKWSPKLINLNPNNKPFKRPWYESHYVAIPGMNQLAKMLATDLPVQLETQIESIEGSSGQWLLKDSSETTFGPFDWVVTAVPAPQAIDLLPPVFSQSELVAQTEFSPCFALMLSFESEVSFGCDAAVVVNSPIAWVKTTTSENGTSVLIHSDNEWAYQNLVDDPQWIENTLVSELGKIFSKQLPKISHSKLHRWRYARCESPIGLPYLLDTQNQIACCGDWCEGGRVEDAFTSGYSLAEKLLTK